MTTSTKASYREYRGGDRHGWLAQMCPALEAGIHARDATDLLAKAEADPTCIPDRGALITLPVWRWGPGGKSLGRKAFSSDGQRLLMPVRTAWLAGTVIVVADDEHAVLADWSVSNLDHQETGVARLTVGQATPGVPESQWEVPTHLSAPACGRRAIVAQLRKIASDGRIARWDAISQLDPWLRRALHNANTAAAIEIAGDPDAQAALDSQDIESLVTDMTLGDERRPGSLSRLLDLMMRESCFARADPMLYARSSLRREAGQEVYRKLGDPRIGAKIRSMHRTGGYASLSELIEAFNVRYPKESLSSQRAVAALTTATMHHLGGSESQSGDNWKKTGDSEWLEADISDDGHLFPTRTAGSEISAVIRRQNNHLALSQDRYVAAGV